jgi:hypothetical protein
MSFDLDAIRAAVSLREAAEAGGVVWDMKRSNPTRGDWWAPCPFHDERSASFHVDEAKGLFNCFGCGAGGDLFAYVMQRDGLEFSAAARALAERGGIAREESEAERAERLARRRRTIEAREREATKEAEGGWRSALRIWRGAEAPGPILHAYLEARGIDVGAMLAALGGWPPTLRYAPDLPYFQPGPTGRPTVAHRGPAMLAAIARNGHITGIHRTWITPTGRARPAGKALDKRIIGRTREIWGAPIRFSPPSQRMVVGEGIETTLAVWSRLLARDGAIWSAEAAVSLGALAGPEDRATAGPTSPTSGRPLPSAEPDWTRAGWTAPDCVAELVILAEGSRKDPAAAERHATRALRRHTLRSDGSSRRARLALPPGGWASGLDFADIAAASRRQTLGDAA